jgi:hypothetical protein
MGKIFNKTKKEGVVTASPPEEQETQAEVEYTKNLSEPQPSKEKQVAKTQDIQSIEVPVCMSQTQINNIVIDNNMMLKHIISKLEE